MKKYLLYFFWVLPGLAAASSSGFSADHLGTDQSAARHWLSQAVAHQCISLNLATWPLPRSAVQHALQSFDEARPGCTPTLQRRLEQIASSNQGGLYASLTLASQEPVWRHFGRYAVDQQVATVGGYASFGRFSGRLEVSAVDGDRDTRELRLEQSYLASRLGNWQLGAGAIDRWWGPGWYSSLALSNNARPVTGIWLGREQQQAFETPLLNWLGPWNLLLTAGQLEQDRAIPDAKLLGARLTFQPLERLEVGLTRLFQWGGEGRPDNLSSLWDAMIGRDNGATTGFTQDDDPSNQIAGFDLRYSFSSTAVYLQMMGEDEAGYLPAKRSLMVGVEWVPEPHWRWVLEHADTRAGGLFGDWVPNVMYEHSTYRNGFRYQGRNLASTWESDAIATTLGVHYYPVSLLEVTTQITHAQLNKAGGIRAFVHNDAPEILQARGSQAIWLWNIQLSHAVPYGALRWEAGATDEAFKSADREHDRWFASLTWTLATRW